MEMTSYYWFMHQTQTFENSNSNISDPENYFCISYHICNLYALLPQGLRPEIGREPQNFQLTFPKTDLFSPEFGPAIMKCFFLRSGIFPASSLDQLTLTVLYLAPSTAAAAPWPGCNSPCWWLPPSPLNSNGSVDANGSSKTFGTWDEESFQATCNESYQSCRNMLLLRQMRIWVEETQDDNNIIRHSIYDVMAQLSIRESMEAMNYGMVPASKESVEALEKVTYEELLHSETNDDQCLICLNCFSEEREKGFRILSCCSHIFHEDCIIRWFQTSHTCPLCRYALPAMDEPCKAQESVHGLD